MPQISISRYSWMWLCWRRTWKSWPQLDNNCIFHFISSVIHQWKFEKTVIRDQIWTHWELQILQLCPSLNTVLVPTLVTFDCTNVTSFWGVNTPQTSPRLSAPCSTISTCSTDCYTLLTNSVGESSFLLRNQRNRG